MKVRQGVSYADTLRELSNESGNIVGVRATCRLRNGNVLLELKPNMSMEAVRLHVEGACGGLERVRTLARRAMIEVR